MRNRISTHILLILMAVLHLSSCNGKEEVEFQNFLEVTPESLQFDAYGGQEYISIRTGEDWLIRSDSNWAKPSETSGKGTSETVKISLVIEKNTEETSRTANITVRTISGISKNVTVTQEGTEGGLVERRGIASAEDLAAFSEAVNSGESINKFIDNGTVILLDNIDVSSISKWTPAGTAENPLSVNFDGKGYSITGIDWTADASSSGNIGIIGYLKNATVRNLTVGSSGDMMNVTGDNGSINIGGIVGYSENGGIYDCTNNLDIHYSGNSSGSTVCIAGICGRSSGEGLNSCVNNGDISTPSVARAAGLVGYNEAKIEMCENHGTVLAQSSGETGPAWCCSYNRTPSDFISNKGRGNVGNYNEYKDSPESAPSDAYLNAVASPAKEGYELSQADIDVTADSYYDWDEVRSVELASGACYTQYSCRNVPRMVNVLEVDLTDPSVEVTAAYADDCVPNPNGNGNSNNGFNIRETLSQLCTRKRSEGQKILAGINSGFFDSNDGISRGFHIEDRHPVYINNPDVVKALPNHSWAFTVFADGTASCSQKSFSGKVKAGGKEFAWHSMNDTILRHISPAYSINLFDVHYKETPHPRFPSLTNKLADRALYIIAEYTGSPMEVNCGYAEAKILSINDGRSNALATLPYITEPGKIGLAISGADASEIMRLVSVGSVIELRCDIAVDGDASRPVLTQNSSMFHIMKDGKDNTSSIPANNQTITNQDPLTFPVISKDGRKVWLVEVDGRQDWFSLGVKAYEIFRIAEKLGGYNVTRLDGGGSSTMWVYDPSTQKGEVVNSPSDSNGERSCMNYILIREKE